MQQKSFQDHDKLTAMANYLSASLLGIVFFPVLIFILELYVRVDIPLKWQLPVVAGIAAPLLCLTFLKKQSLGIRLLCVFLFAWIVAKALIIAGAFDDPTCDSMAYHADIILLSLRGVNPIYEWMHGFDDVWTNHYPKAMEYFASLIIHLTHNYNMGKCYNILLTGAVFAYIFSFMNRRGYGGGNSLLAAFAISLNPVVISQMLSFYIDGALASLTTLAVFSGMALLFASRSIDRLVFILSACLLISTKFTGAAHIAVIGMIAVAIAVHRYYFISKDKESPHAVRRPLKGLLLSLTLIALLGGLVMGFNPYIENFVWEGNPFVPLMGMGKHEVLAAQSPKSFKENDTSLVDRLLISIFSRTGNVIPGGFGTSEPVLKVPFSVSSEELSLLQYNDVRISGWGVLFSGILLVAIALYLGSASWKNSEITIGLLFTVCTILINPGNWWARYAPQVALIPALMAIPPLVSQMAWQRITARFVFVLLLFNSMLIIPSNVEYFYNATKTINAQVDTILKTCGEGTYEISDTQNFHYEPFLWGTGINITYPKEDITKTHKENELFPLDDVFLHKDGCVRK